MVLDVENEILWKSFTDLAIIFSNFVLHCQDLFAWKKL